LSFFDDVDETRVEPPSPRRRRPSGGARRPPSGGGRRPPGGGRRGRSDAQAIRIRQAVALGVLVIAIVLIAVGVHSCDVSATNNALRDYSDNVSALISHSDQTSQQFFTLLSSGKGSSNALSFESEIETAGRTTSEQLKSAENFNVPSQMKTAQTDLLLALQLRYDGIHNIGDYIEQALQATTATSAVTAIAAQMARFYASDVLYKDYSLPAISAALHGAGIPVGGTNGQPLNEGQFFPNLEWLQPTYVALELHATTASTGAHCSGLHGHQLNSVSVGGTMLSTGATNALTASPPPSFSLNITNGGNFTQNNVILKVTLSGSSISGETTIPQTTAGETTTGTVTLNASPPAGNYTVTAEVVPVPCEVNTSNNYLSFPVTFN
jgi:hypothetical protein